MLVPCGTDADHRVAYFAAAFAAQWSHTVHRVLVGCVMLVLSASVSHAEDPCHDACYGTCYEASGEDAIVQCGNAISGRPDDVRAYMTRARAYAAADLKRLAITDYGKAIQLEPRLVVAYRERAQAFDAISDYGRALIDLSKADRT
jgi:tetratricopeptide (TPR) repeat protein